MLIVKVLSVRLIKKQEEKDKMLNKLQDDNIDVTKFGINHKEL